jgi:lysophospholipase L1-like esterase
MTGQKSSRSKAEVCPSPRQTWCWWLVAMGAIGVGALLGLGVAEILPALMQPVGAVQVPVDNATQPSLADRSADVADADRSAPDAVDATATQVARETKKAPRPPAPPAPVGKLATFYDALLKLEGGNAATPVTVLHLGDSHIASDRITGEVRRLLQARFGDAGRGLMMPGFPFPYYKAPGFTFEKSGKWTVANSLTDDGDYGVSGVSLTANSADASLKLISDTGPFASAEVSLLAAPGNGHAVIAAGTLRQVVATGTEQRSVLRVALPGQASSVKIEASGDGPVTVLGWSVDSGRQGVRYVNLGIPGASALTTNRFDRALAASDIKAIAPQLVVLGYGTNEGFNDGLDLAAYEKDYVRLVTLIKDAAPEASLVILGPLDGARHPSFAKTASKAGLPCRPLSDSERANYDQLLSAKDQGMARWYTPPKLDEVRSVLAHIAGRYGAIYWDLSKVMGGPCSIDRWVKAEPPLGLPDHVHLSGEGSRRIGQAIYEALIADYDRHRRQAGVSGSLAPEGTEAAPRVAGR